MRTFGPPDRHPEFLTCEEVVAVAREAGFHEGAIELVMARTDNDEGG
jgi:hypothetical protein